VPVIAIPYWARVLKMPPVGVKTEGLVQLVTTGRGEAGEAWSIRISRPCASPTPGPR
jgi:hypothetical protein